jgi:energy-coupling factor transporter ATP-binding protein EcfA2
MGALMRFTHFSITNYKGIESARLDLLDSPVSKVHTLVGLNESGKTTLLEAINLITYEGKLDPFNLPGDINYDPHALIPISKRANFNGKISLEAGVRIDQPEKDRIIQELRDDVVEIQVPDTLTLSKEFEFQSSRWIASEVTIPRLQLEIKVRLKGQSELEPLTGELWAKAEDVVRRLLPRIVYFPNFLFDFPDKIYLENPPADALKHKFYCTVLQDVLDAINDGTNVQEHILGRASTGTEADKRNMESVLRQMGRHISREVLKKWDKLFLRSQAAASAGDRRIEVSIDQDSGGPWYVQLQFNDGVDAYSIVERSLGFRWFFAYVMLMRYRALRNSDSKNVLFLLDEPASNLHSSAQNQLLDSFKELPEGCQIVYTTHSHHLINPEWLERAYVVKNAGLDYTHDQDDYSARRTSITLTQYRQFAAQYPNQTTYFQPVLDVLDYSPNRLENVPDAVIVEGKNDFYFINFLQGLVAEREHLNLMPGWGATSLAPMIQLYVGWGRSFIVVLDSDDEGERQKLRYEETFEGLVKARVFTLREFVPELSGKALESILTDSERLAIQRQAYPNTSYEKVLFNRAIQELTLLRKAPEGISKPSLGRIRMLLDGLHRSVQAARLLWRQS